MEEIYYGLWRFKLRIGKFAGGRELRIFRRKALHRNTIALDDVHINRDIISRSIKDEFYYG